MLQDSLSEALWRVPSEEELLMDMTSRSTRGCWIEPPESLPPMPMVELERKEDMIKGEYLEDWRRRIISTRREKIFKRKKAKIWKWPWSQLKHPLHLKWRRTLQKWCSNFSHQDTPLLTHAPCLQYVPTPWVTHIQEYCVCAAHTYSKRQNVMFVFNASSNNQKRA